MKQGNFTYSLEDLWSGLPRVGRLLGLDVGGKRIGVAISDPGRLIGNPMTIIKRETWKDTFKELQKLTTETEIYGIIVGYPIHLNGEEGAACQSVRSFCRNLQEAGLGIKLVLWDERLTTQASERHLIKEADLSRSKQANLNDSVAASMILQNVLDYARHHNFDKMA